MCQSLCVFYETLSDICFYVALTLKQHVTLLD